MKWVEFDQQKWDRQPLPPARRHLLVQVAAKAEEGLPPAVAVGYMRFAAGCKDSPTFTIPGVGGTVVAWCDCLPDDFTAPLWPGARDNIANVIVQANLAPTLTSHPSLSPTHCCVDCGALWRQCDDFSMNLRSASCCDACDNAPVEPQIRPIYVAPSSADVERRPCTCHPDDNPPVPCPRMYALQDCRRAAALAAENTALQRRIALQKGEPTPEQINHFIECAAIELAHARTFVTSRQKMHPDGVELYDMTLNSARAIRDALRAADSASNREIAHDE